MSLRQRLKRLETRSEQSPRVGGWRSDPVFAAQREAQFAALFEELASHGADKEILPAGENDPFEHLFAVVEAWRRGVQV